MGRGHVLLRRVTNLPDLSVVSSTKSQTIGGGQTGTEQVCQPVIESAPDTSIANS